ncbi:MAG: RDD family protein [Nitrosopumilus sp.]|nr:MAG: RDD family protein [Nitrosopumilus sp.]
MNDEKSEVGSRIILAKWTDRFLAWLVDFIIISSVSTLIIFALFGTIYYEMNDGGFWAENTQYVPTSIMFFVYWVILEYKTGQTLGKKALNLRVMRTDGLKPDLKGILLSSLGKSFLLPVDIILGVVLTNEKRQRIFNKLGDTVVVKIKDVENTSDVTYVKD